MTDDDMDPGQDVAMRLAVEALAVAPRHPGHRHGLVVGSGLTPESGVPFLVVAVQGLRGPVYVPLDAEDLAIIAGYAAGQAPDGSALAVLATGRLH